VTYNDGQVGEGWGSITGWLSANESYCINDEGEAAELWYVVFDDTALGEEDLEEHEVKEAVLAGQGVLSMSKKPKTAITRLQKANFSKIIICWLSVMRKGRARRRTSRA
jgi:hypothetical protein